MWLIRAALRRPITVLVAVAAIALTSAFAVSRMRADIFPDLDLPVIYVAQPYGGMSPAQMEGFITYYYEYHFLYINGIESVESKSIQNTSLLKLTFHAGSDMAEAMAQTIGYVNRARAFMPPGTVGAFVMRFDAGTVPVGYLVFKSDTRSLGEIQDLALNRVRPQFATLPGLTSPPPFGGSQRTIVIRVDPDKLRAHGMSANEVIDAVTTGNVIMPSGSVNIGDETRISPINSVVGSINDLLELPIRTGSGTPVSIRDIGSVADSTDIPTAYALVDGRRAVYIPVTKRPDASTLSVVQEVRNNLARFQALVPDDIEVSYELDQSGNVAASLRSVVVEAGLGALLTGLMVLLFLRDWRSSAIVVITIPFALLTAVVALWGAGQTINIMTLGGLALAVGILVDEATVAIENIHTHLARGTPVARAVLEASGEVVTPRLLAMLAVVAVFVPSFFMTGVSRSLFVPLSLAVGCAMIASFLLSSSLVPVLGVWMLGRNPALTGRRTAQTGWTGCARVLAACLDDSPRCAWHSWPVIWSPRWVWSPWSRRCWAVRSSRPAARRSSSCASARLPAQNSRPPNSSGERYSTRSPRRQVRAMSPSRSATWVCSHRRIPSTRSSCGLAARMKACSRCRSGLGRACGWSRSKNRCASASARSSRRRRSRSSQAIS